MANTFESHSFVLPSQVKKDVASRFKHLKGIKSLELKFKGDELEGGKEFGEMLTFLMKRGVRVSHEVVIKLDFPKAISRDKTLLLVENMPKPKNGAVKVRIKSTG